MQPDAMKPMLTLPQLYFDAGAIRALPGVLAGMGVQRPFLLTDQGLVQCGVFARVRGALAGQPAITFEDVPENPTYAGVDRAAAVYRAEGCDGVVAVGGGSVIDTAKLVSVLGGNPGQASDYCGRLGSVKGGVVPLVAIPTTAGTGSEASPGAGIHPDAVSISLGVSSPLIVPRVAICDPELTVTLPPRLTAATGLDALSHCVEGYLSTTVSPLADAMALDGITRICRFLPRAVANGTDIEARWHVMMAAFAGGVAIGNGLGPAHAIAINCGDQGLHHGMLSALGLVASLEVMEPHQPEKVAQIAAAMELPKGQSAAEGTRSLMRQFGLPATLRGLGYQPADLNALGRMSRDSYFNHTSPYKPDADEFARMIAGIME